jgi:hypothetical protein
MMTKGIDYDVVHNTNGNLDENVLEFLAGDLYTEDTVIWFSDLCPSEDVLLKVQAAVKTVYVVDHHRTNMYALNFLDAEHGIVVPTQDGGKMESGTSLLFQKMVELGEGSSYRIDKGALTNGSFKHREYISHFVDTVRSYDTYEWKDTGNKEAKELQTLFYLLGTERFSKMYLRLLRDPSMTDEHVIPHFGIMTREFVDAKLEAEQRAIDSFTLDDIVDCNVRGYRTALLMKPAGAANISELANQFLVAHPEFDVFAQFSLTDGGGYSFRAIRNDIDLGAEIAAPLGGGGHPKAAGAMFKQDMKDRLKDMIIQHLNGALDD